MYQPNPIDTSDVKIPEELEPLMETLARNTHEVWSQGRMNEGWTYGPARSDERKEHPGLVPYDALSEAEKDYDRATSRETLRVMLKLGYRITKEHKE